MFDGDADLTRLFAGRCNCKGRLEKPVIHANRMMSINLPCLFITDDRMFSNTGNILCGKPFPRSDNIRYVDRMIYSQDFKGANPDELEVMPSKRIKESPGGLN